jgi:hypothetical protein
MFDMQTPELSPSAHLSRRRGRLPQLSVLVVFAVVVTAVAFHYGAAPSDTSAPPVARTGAGKPSTAQAKAAASPAAHASPQAAAASPTPAPSAATPSLPPVTMSADSPFWQTWARVDQPVADGSAQRAWVWGDARSTFTHEMTEPYVEGTNGQREVMYFDYGRMEITDPNVAQTDPWRVTVGLLVVEMVRGQIQVGDAAVDHSRAPAELDIVAGGASTGGVGVTYADIHRLGLLSTHPLAEGSIITQHVTRDHALELDPALAQYNVTAAVRVQAPAIDHTIASPFWEYMQRVGVTFVPSDQAGAGHETVTQLFEDPFYVTGYPITEAYWAHITADGQARDVLWQCFERRCLTYTPSNPTGFQVESGKVGDHYVQWRYGTGARGSGAHPTAALHERDLADARRKTQRGALVG